MSRIFSYILIVSGLLVAGLGLHSIWTTRQGAREAEKEWESLADRQQQRSAPAIHAVPKGSPLARLSIERLGGEWVVVEGADVNELRKGPGHMINTALPGSRGNCVIAGHRDTQFRILRNVEVGERISVEIEGHTYTYRVTDRRVVSPNDTRSLLPTAKATLTLVTCFPFYYVGPAPKRYLIRAVLVS
jgi:sortase A